MYISHYLNKFERLLWWKKIYDIPLAELAYRILKFATLSNEQQQVAKATIADLKHENIKKRKNWNQFMTVTQLVDAFYLK